MEMLQSLMFQILLSSNDLSITNLGTINVSFSNVEGGIDGSNNFDSDLTCNTSIGNYQLAFLSPSLSTEKMEKLLDSTTNLTKLLSQFCIEF